MKLAEFRKTRVEGREELLKKILEVFKHFKPIKIQQFGSGKGGYKDEFSDIDLWITFEEDQIKSVVKNQAKIFKSIAPILVKHSSKSWSPKEGSATQIIYNIKHSSFQVDYYISKDFYQDDFFRSIQERSKNSRKKSHTLKKDIDLFLCLILISIKGIIRKWESPEFENNIKIVYKRLRMSYGQKLKHRQVKLNFKFIYRILDDLYPVASKTQQKAINRIRNYTALVESSYKV